MNFDLLNIIEKYCDIESKIKLSFCNPNMFLHLQDALKKIRKIEENKLKKVNTNTRSETINYITLIPIFLKNLVKVKDEPKNDLQFSQLFHKYCSKSIYGLSCLMFYRNHVNVFVHYHQTHL